MIKEKAKTDQLMYGVGRIALKIPISPNAWTVLSLLPAVAGFWLAFEGKLVFAVIAFAVSGFIDGIDGAVARLTGRATALGAFIDGTIDRLVDFLLVFSFLFVGLPDLVLPMTWWVVIGAYFGIMPTFVVAYANHRGAVEDPYEKVVWRILHRVEMFVLWLLALLAAAFDPSWGSYLFVFVSVLSVVTTFQTILLAVARSKQQSAQGRRQ